MAAYRQVSLYTASCRQLREVGVGRGLSPKFLSALFMLTGLLTVYISMLGTDWRVNLVTTQYHLE